MQYLWSCKCQGKKKLKKSKNKDEVIKEYFDKELFINGLDTNLFDQIIEMYNNSR